MFSMHDRLILRDLASNVRDIASQEIMQARRVLWMKHNRLEKTGPLILVFPEGSWREMISEDQLQCEGQSSRAIELELRKRIYQHHFINDDQPIEKTWTVYKTINNIKTKGSLSVNNWGLAARHLTTASEHGAFGFDPVIHSAQDLQKLRVPELSYDEQSTMEEFELVYDLLGDILDVQLKGLDYISFHFMSSYCHLRGLEQMLYDLYDEPEMVHEAMRFFLAGYNNLIDQCLEQKLLSLNNGGAYVSSGGLGYTDELPRSTSLQGLPFTNNLWASAESQEMTSVSPEMHEEFAMQYERKILARFGLTGYGCCDDLTRKMQYVFKTPNLRRVSISPWADIDACAQQIQKKCIMSWKPNPAYIAGDFDLDFIGKYLDQSIKATKENVLEIVLKDTHTCSHHPERFGQWVSKAREIIGRHD
ncbi:MAG TPA: hypothetical protein DCM45_04730 [Clostridiales bacterium]|nr:hypothetical protein [Clostridiales bacterium]